MFHTLLLERDRAYAAVTYILVLTFSGLSLVMALISLSHNDASPLLLLPPVPGSDANDTRAMISQTALESILDFLEHWPAAPLAPMPPWWQWEEKQLLDKIDHFLFLQAPTPASAAGDRPLLPVITPNPTNLTEAYAALFTQPAIVNILQHLNFTELQTQLAATLTEVLENYRQLSESRWGFWLNKTSAAFLSQWDQWGNVSLPWLIEATRQNLAGPVPPALNLQAIYENLLPPPVRQVLENWVGNRLAPVNVTTTNPHTTTTITPTPFPLDGRHSPTTEFWSANASLMNTSSFAV